MIEVAVIGAGAAGLVTARHLLKCGFRPVIFEQRTIVGGSWTSSSSLVTTPTTGDGTTNNDKIYKMWDTLYTNLSKYTCCFSELSYSETTPLFPNHIDVSNYLDNYANKFLRSNDNCLIKYGCTVTNIERSSSSSLILQQEQQSTATLSNQQTRSSSTSYKVEWIDSVDQEQKTQEFSTVIIATGFFTKPYLPGIFQNIMNKQQQEQQKLLYPLILHSSQYRTVDESYRDQNIVVIGSSFSAHEIAVDICRSGLAKSVYNIAGSSQIPWILPRYVPTKSTLLDTSTTTTTIVPLDLHLFRRKKCEAPQIPESIYITTDIVQQQHTAIENLVGSYKHKIAFDGQLPDKALPPIVSISDNYLNYVINKNIQYISGKKNKIQSIQISDTDSTLSAPKLTIQFDNNEQLQDIDRIIACTGYECDLNFIHTSLLQEMEYNADDNRFCPLTLCYDTYHPSVPNFGFVGMYKGPFFGTIELQARFMANKMKQSSLTKSTVPWTNVSDDEQVRIGRLLRTQHPRPPKPHYDTIGHMDTYAHLLNIVPPTNSGGGIGDVALPAYYIDEGDDTTIARQCQSDVANEFTTDKDGNRIAQIVYNALVGKWNFYRTIEDALTKNVQIVQGTIRYTLESPKFNTLRYREDGYITLFNGNKLEVFREYRYQQPVSDCLDIYFMDEPTKLFLSLKFQPSSEQVSTRGSNQQHQWTVTASSDHLCIEDLYKGTFDVIMDGVCATQIIQTYRVKGPNKDYTSTTTLTPAYP